MSNKVYRAQLLEAAAALGAQEARQTPEAQLQRIVIQGLGLPNGTILTDEQWDMVLKAQQPPQSAPDGALSHTQSTTGALEGLSEAPRR
jgi:hypothetical protein